ncbi:hypothetical protein, partial [Scytonema sp. NUACC21]
IFACADSAMVATGAAIGQVLIPMLVIGAVIGSISGRMVSDLCKELLGIDAQIAKRVEQHYQNFLSQIHRASKTSIVNLVAKYEQLGNLASNAFDFNLNFELRLQASIKLAEAYGVSDDDIIHNIDELDAFMLS